MKFIKTFPNRFVSPQSCALLLLSGVRLICNAQNTVACSAPPIHDLLLRSEQAQQASDAKLPEYEFVLIRSGRVESAVREQVPSEVYLRYTVRGVALQRLYLENGTTLSQKRQKEVEKNVAEAILRGPQKSHKDPNTMESPVALGKAGTFSNLRCRTVDGRRSFVYDYDGDPKAKTSGMDLKLAAHTKGTIAFDAEEGATASINVKLSGDMRIALIIKVKKGMEFTIASTRMGSGVWQKRAMSFSGGARIFFNGVSATYREDYLEYKEVGRLDDDPYRGVGFGQLPPSVRGAMVSGLEAVGNEPVPDEEQPVGPE